MGCQAGASVQLSREGSSSAGERQSLLSIPVDEQLSSVFLCEHLLEPQLPFPGSDRHTRNATSGPFLFPLSLSGFFCSSAVLPGPLWC